MVLSEHFFYNCISHCDIFLCFSGSFFPELTGLSCWHDLCTSRFPAAARPRHGKRDRGKQAGDTQGCRMAKRETFSNWGDEK
jgi:hypothetical protein